MKEFPSWGIALGNMKSNTKVPKAYLTGPYIIL